MRSQFESYGKCLAIILAAGVLMLLAPMAAWAQGELHRERHHGHRRGKQQQRRHTLLCESGECVYSAATSAIARRAVHPQLHDQF